MEPLVLLFVETLVTTSPDILIILILCFCRCFYGESGINIHGIEHVFFMLLLSLLGMLLLSLLGMLLLSLLGMLLLSLLGMLL
ncbi:MAG: hypothetical protein PVF16_07255, partial [Chromatiales bacterium]